VSAKGLARVKLLLVDGGGNRQIVTLEPPTWQLAPTTKAGEPIVLTHLELVGVESVEP
jgi:hypothetical protein